MAVATVIAGSVVIALRSGASVAGFQRISFAAHHGVVQLGAGRWVGYYEAGNLSRSNLAVPDFRPLISDPRDDQVNVENYVPQGRPTPGLSYDEDGHRGIATFQFDASRAGTFHVKLQFAGGVPPGADVAIGRDLSAGTGTSRTGVVLVVAGGLLGIVAVLLLAVEHRRRERTVVSGDA